MEQSKTHFQIVDAVKAGEPYEFAGASSGRKFKLTYKAPWYVLTPGPGAVKGAVKLKPTKLKYEGALTVVANSLLPKNKYLEHGGKMEEKAIAMWASPICDVVPVFYKKGGQQL